MRRRTVLGGVTAVLATLAVLATAGAALAGATVEVSISDYKFQPADLTVSPGTTVRWVNAERRASHSVLFLGAQGFESERMFPGESWSRRFDEPGEYPYGCGPHPEMKGVVRVVADK
jgi:plastocyanin